VPLCEGSHRARPYVPLYEDPHRERPLCAHGRAGAPVYSCAAAPLCFSGARARRHGIVSPPESWRRARQ
jgi:hypothetical protein